MTSTTHALKKQDSKQDDCSADPSRKAQDKRGVTGVVEQVFPRTRAGHNSAPVFSRSESDKESPKSDSVMIAVEGESTIFEEGG